MFMESFRYVPKLWNSQNVFENYLRMLVVLFLTWSVLCFNVFFPLPKLVFVLVRPRVFGDQRGPSQDKPVEISVLAEKRWTLPCEVKSLPHPTLPGPKKPSSSLHSLQGRRTGMNCDIVKQSLGTDGCSGFQMSQKKKKTFYFYFLFILIGV